MRQRKFTFLLVALLVVSGLLFAGGEARAANYSTFNYSVIQDSPFFLLDHDGKGGTYYYIFDGTLNPGSPSITTVEFEIPVAIDIGSSPPEVKYFNSTGGLLGSPAITIFGPGNGDPVLKLGIEDTRYRVLKLVSTTFPYKFKLSLHIMAAAVTTGKKLGYASQVVLLATNAGVTDLGVVDTPSVEDVPVKPAPVITIESVYPNPLVLTKQADGSIAKKPTPCAVLTWSSTGANSFAITPNGTITGNSAEVCPPAIAGTYWYTITATGDGGEKSDSASVTVAPLVGFTALVTISANPPVISLGDCTKLTWTTANASFAFISNIEGGPVKTNPDPAIDCVVVCPRENTIYTLTAIRWDGTTATDCTAVNLLPDRLAPAPNTVQTICIGDVQQGTNNCGSAGAITFKIFRDPIFGVMTNLYVCNDADYNTFARGNSTCNARVDLPDCCQFQDPSPGAEKVVNCTNMTGAGLAECLILGFGSPHYATGVNGVINKNYPYCRTGETPGKDPTTGKIIECYTDTGRTIIHTD